MKYILLLLPIIVFSACDPKGAIDRAGKAAKDAAEAIDPVKIEGRVKAELELERLKNQYQNALTKGGGLDNAWIEIPAQPTDTQLVIVATNVAKAHGTGTIEVQLIRDGKVLVENGGRQTEGMKTEAAIRITLAAGHAVRFEAVGKNTNALSGNVEIAAYVAKPIGG